MSDDRPSGTQSVRAGAWLAAAGVAAGAFGAHALRATVSPDRLDVWDTAVFYHVVHALGLILTGLLQRGAVENKILGVAGWSMGLGVVAFSGSLYLLVLTDTRWLGIVTPFGGVALMVGWVLVAVGTGRRRVLPD